MKTIIRLTVVGALASLLLLAISGTASSQSVPAGTKNIVLVHGAFADGSSWERVIPLLQAKGFRVIAVQNPLTSLEDDVAATKRAIAQMDGPVLLVGHSWAGMVITEAGIDPKVAGLVYICALIPNEGQSVVDVVSALPPAPGSGEFQTDAFGFLSLSSKGINEYFAQDLSASQRRVLFATQVPWAANSTVQKVSNIAWKAKPAWVLIGAEDKTINPDLQRAEAAMIKATVLELRSNHVPMLSEPRKVANFIMEAADRLPVGQGLAQTN